MLFPVFVVLQDFMGTGSQSTKAVRASRLLEDILVCLSSLACTARTIGRTTVCLKLVTGVL
jgi:hypothetical protein